MGNEKINDILNNLVKSYQQNYGFAVFSIVAKKSKDGMRLSGIVLTENQKDELLNLIRQSGLKISGEKISVLSDEKQRNEIGWGIVKNKMIDLKSRFVSNKIINERILKRIRCSQAFRGEIARILFKNEDQFLIQQNDLTLGWIDKKDIEIKKGNLYKKWNNGNFAKKNGTHKNGIDGRCITEEAKKYVGTKYALGGKSKDGIDCSGFVQSVYKNAAGLILPKHSWDQKKAGIKIELKDAKTGDLAFLIKKRNSHKHVGIFERKKDKIYLIHASLDKKEVVRQNIDEVLENYDLVEARRVLE